MGQILNQNLQTDAVEMFVAKQHFIAYFASLDDLLFLASNTAIIRPSRNGVARRNAIRLFTALSPQTSHKHFDVPFGCSSTKYFVFDMRRLVVRPTTCLFQFTVILYGTG
jgi:hypothetical protein